ncbi:hypothetical protein HK096_005477, partial [Nowakowskiella sp. JEL0078]
EAIRWVETLFSSQPKWVIEPSIETAAHTARTILQLPEFDGDITTFASGAFNKLFLIECSKGSFVLRVSMPVDPLFKTLSEVATMNLLSSFSSIPVPRVFTYQTDCQRSLLGQEFILMEKMPGETLHSAWHKMKMTHKISLVESIARVLRTMYASPKMRFLQIGNVYRTNDIALCGEPYRFIGENVNAMDDEYVVGRIVSMPFFWNARLQQDVPRGPFKSSQEWLRSRLLLVLNECNSKLERLHTVQRENEKNDEKSLDSDTEEEDVLSIKLLVQRLIRLLPDFFSDSNNEYFVLHHDDINRSNILVRPEDGHLTAILDWECVSVVPMWKAFQTPKFLQSRERKCEPDFETYSKLEDGAPNELYLEHKLDWECSNLRRIFERCMDDEWVEVSRRYCKKADFEFAVHECDSELWIFRINRWLDMVEAGEPYRSLRAMPLLDHPLAM